MAILRALISVLARSASTVLNAIFGWAVVALFGQRSAREQTVLSVVVAAAAAGRSWRWASSFPSWRSS